MTIDAKALGFMGNLAGVRGTLECELPAHTTTSVFRGACKVGAFTYMGWWKYDLGKLPDRDYSDVEKFLRNLAMAVANGDIPEMIFRTITIEGGRLT